MRVIKFRTYDTVKKQYRVGAGFLLDVQSGKLYEGIDVEDGIESNHVILEQFTGLLDSKGKEIYEGDIVTRPADRRKGIVEYVIGPSVFNCGFAVRPENEKGHYALWGDSQTVIGNIHEEAADVQP